LSICEIKPLEKRGSGFGWVAGWQAPSKQVWRQNWLIGFAVSQRAAFIQDNSALVNQLLLSDEQSHDTLGFLQVP